MNTPICDFLAEYAKKDNVRLHMPGHKGIGDTERLDLTEIEGADSLYEASGIIKESEANASRLFASHTLYSTEGSSLAIRAMLYLALLTANGERATVLAGRNAHKVFVSAAALLDCDVEWLAGDGSYLSCKIEAGDVEKKLLSMEKKPLALYLTSPDYLGNVSDIGAIAEVCKRHGVLLLVDNAHGAYLAFCEPSAHPIALGADMCADSAHKTLPCLTGAAYLHIADTMPHGVKERAKSALALFGSTSPSYLILASLDKANAYLEGGYKEKLSAFTKRLSALKARLANVGYEVVGDEPMKLTLMPKSYGYTGYEMAEHLSKMGFVPEFSDPDFLVLMPTPEINDAELKGLLSALTALERRAPITDTPPAPALTERATSPREAVLSSAERIAVENAEGRILADVTVGCPPAVPIVVSGERISKEAIKAFKYYGIDFCTVVK